MSTNPVAEPLCPARLETAANRAISKARKLRVRLGDGPSVLDPFPERPPHMHRWTYYRLLDKATAAEERVIALDLGWLRARGFLSEVRGVKS